MSFSKSVEVIGQFCRVRPLETLRT